MPNPNFTRRGFLKGMGVAGAALGAGGVSVPTAEAQVQRGPDRSIRISELPPEHFRIRRKPIQWPNDARIAVCWIVNFECYTDAADAYDIAYKDYSCKAGVWRMMDMYDELGVKAGWYTNALIATRFPETLRELARRGHEIDGHNWANNIPLTSLSEDAEREVIRRTFADIENACGVRITGWMGSGGNSSPRTLGFLEEEGLLWNGDYPSDDVPYTVPVNGRKIVMIPYSREANDTQTYGSLRHHPRACLDRFKQQFDVLYEEGKEYPQLLFFSTHAWLLGHPLGIKAIREAIRYTQGFPHVWQATENEIAKWWLDQGYD